MNVRATVSAVEDGLVRVIINGEAAVTPLLKSIQNVNTIKNGDTVLVAVISSYSDAIVVGVVP